jgi:hypothetical protein
METSYKAETRRLPGVRFSGPCQHVNLLELYGNNKSAMMRWGRYFSEISHTPAASLTKFVKTKKDPKVSEMFVSKY